MKAKVITKSAVAGRKNQLGIFIEERNRLFITVVDGIVVARDFFDHNGSISFGEVEVPDEVVIKAEACIRTQRDLARSRDGIEEIISSVRRRS